MIEVAIDTRSITGWREFHAEFASKFGFPAYYGENLNAWIDCMSYLADEANDSSFSIQPGQTLCMVLPACDAWASMQPEIFKALTDCVAFVNRRYAENGDGTQIVVKPT